nr:unnamed protein product [Callosobruchus analis]
MIQINGKKVYRLFKNTTYHEGIRQSPYKAFFGVKPKRGIASSSLPNVQITNIETEEQLEAYINTCEENLDSDHIDDHVPDESDMDDQSTFEVNSPSSKVLTDPQPSMFPSKMLTDQQTSTSSIEVLTDQQPNMSSSQTLADLQLSTCSSQSGMPIYIAILLNGWVFSQYFGTIDLFASSVSDEVCGDAGEVQESELLVSVSESEFAIKRYPYKLRYDVIVHHMSVNSEALSFNESKTVRDFIVTVQSINMYKAHGVAKSLLRCNNVHDMNVARILLILLSIKRHSACMSRRLCRIIFATVLVDTVFSIMAEEEDLDNFLQPLIAKKEMYYLRLQSLYEFSRNISEDPAVLAEFNARLNDIHKYERVI